MAGNIVISQINGGPIGVINAIINGNFQVNQRGVSGTVTLAAGAYGHDRWKAGASGCTYTFATVNNVTTLTITAGSLIQVIEGINLYSGTYALSWSGTAQGKIGAGSYSGSGVTGSVTGGTNLSIEFNTGTLSLVQFEPGTEVSPFERRDYGRELMMCQRYYYRTQDDGSLTIVISGGVESASVMAGSGGSFPATMRAIPTMAMGSGLRVYSNATTTQTTSLTGNRCSATTMSGQFSMTGATGGQAAVIFRNGASGYLEFSAEL